MIYNFMYLIVAIICCIFCSTSQKPEVETVERYKVSIETFTKDIENLKQALFELLIGSKHKSKVDKKRIDSHVNILTKPFISKIKLFNELGNSIDKQQFTDFLKYDIKCIEEDTERFQVGGNKILKRININKLKFTYKPGSEKKCDYYRRYQLEITMILGETNGMIDTLCKNRKEIYEAYNNIGALQIYTKSTGLEASCIKQIVDFTLYFNDIISKSFK
ncbi:hypothetical protein COBT_002338 [Conglomerata obtusa]